MTVIVFLIDTSASMCRKTATGMRILDVAKTFAEAFVKQRRQCSDSREDRYILASFEDPPRNIKAGWKSSFDTFVSQLHRLGPNAMTTTGLALKRVFDYLNLNRLRNGIDTYGNGWRPFRLESCAIVLLTDAGSLNSEYGAEARHLTIPMHAPIPGAELTQEPFRWDQRLFVVTFDMRNDRFFACHHHNLPSCDNCDPNDVPHDASSLRIMAEVTGGRSYLISSQSFFNSCVTDLVLRASQRGVVVNFETCTGDRPTSETESAKCFVHVPKISTSSDCYCWPIPESFSPEIDQEYVPQRKAHPTLVLRKVADHPKVPSKMPVEKYAVHPCRFTNSIVRSHAVAVWTVHVRKKDNHSELTHSFGILRTNSDKTSLVLQIMPYNYPKLTHIFDRFATNDDWLCHLLSYVNTLPIYYYPAVKRMLLKLALPERIVQNIIPTCLDDGIAYSNLKVITKEAKCRLKRLDDQITKAQIIPTQANLYVQIEPRPWLPASAKYNFDKFLLKLPTTTEDKKTTRKYMDKDIFQIERKDLLEYIGIMNENVFGSPVNYNKTNVPICQMGNFHEHKKNAVPPLRDLELVKHVYPTFGNPFKAIKKIVIDETDGSSNLERKSGEKTNLKKSSFCSNKSRSHFESGFEMSNAIECGEDDRFSKETSKNARKIRNVLRRAVLFSKRRNSSSSTTLARQANQHNQEFNTKLKRAIFQDIINTGMNLEEIFLHIKRIRGKTFVKKLLLEEILSKAYKNNQSLLVRQLIDYLSTFDDIQNPNYFNQNEGTAVRKMSTVARYNKMIQTRMFQMLKYDLYRVNFDSFVSEIDYVKGGRFVKMALLKDLVKEARRVGKTDLVNQIEDYVKIHFVLEKLYSDSVNVEAEVNYLENMPLSMKVTYHKTNQKIKYKLFRELRKPCVTLDNIVCMLDLIKGGILVKIAVTKEITKEACKLEKDLLAEGLIAYSLIINPNISDT